MKLEQGLLSSDADGVAAGDLGISFWSHHVGVWAVPNGPKGASIFEYDPPDGTFLGVPKGGQPFCR